MDVKSTDTNKVAISGLGPVCSVACGVDQLYKKDATATSNDWFDPTLYLGERGFKYLTPATRFVLAAAKVVMEDSKLDENCYTPEECGVMVGTTFAGLSAHQEFDEVILDEGARRLSPMSAPNFAINLAASHISIKHTLRAFNITQTTPFIAGVEAIQLGARAIQSGRAKMVLAGATEERASEDVANFLGVENMEEGSCLFMLENLEQVKKANRKIYAILGPAVNGFYPPAQLSTASGHEKLTEYLRRELDSIIDKGTKTINYMASIYGDTYSTGVDRTVQKILSEMDIEINVCNEKRSGGGLLTVSPVLDLARLAGEPGIGLLVSVSPFGQLAMQIIEN